MADIYRDGTYLQNNPSWGEEDSSWKADRIVKLIERNALKPASICDIGCGAGEILIRLSQRLDAGIKYHGYEISPQAYEICRKKAKDNISFFLKGLSEVDDGQFDIAMAIDVFEHVEDYFGFLKELKTKSEYKIFHIPLDLTVLTVLRPSSILETRRTYWHLHHFCKDTALAALEHAGYEIVDYFHTGSAVELPNASWKAGLLKPARKLMFRINRDLAARLLGGYSLLVLAK